MAYPFTEEKIKELLADPPKFRRAMMHTGCERQLKQLPKGGWLVFGDLHLAKHTGVFSQGVYDPSFLVDGVQSVNRRVWRSILALECLCSCVDVLQPSVIISIGDLSDDVKSLDGSLVTILEHYLTRLGRAAETICVAGNHDFFGGNYLLLAKRSVRHVWKRPATKPLHARVCNTNPTVLFLPYGVCRSVAAKAIDKVKPDFTFAHTVVSCPALPDYMADWDTEYRLEMSDIKYGQFLSGHVHRRHSDENYHYIGPLIQQSFMDEGVLCGALYIDDGQNTTPDATAYTYLNFQNIGVSFTTYRMIGTGATPHVMRHARRQAALGSCVRCKFVSPSIMLGTGFGSDPIDDQILPVIDPAQSSVSSNTSVVLAPTIDRAKLIDNAMKEYVRAQGNHGDMQRIYLNVGLAERKNVGNANSQVAKAGNPELSQHQEGKDIPF